MQYFFLAVVLLFVNHIKQRQKLGVIVAANAVGIQFKVALFGFGKRFYQLK